MDDMTQMQVAESSVTDEDFAHILAAVREFVREKVVPREDEIMASDAIPDDIIVDVSGYEVGDSIHISAVTLPAGVKPAISDRDFTIATIVAPSSLKSEEGDTTKDA